MYTSDPGYTGTDSVTFGGRDTVMINVVPAATARTPSSTVPNAAGAVLDQVPARLDDGWAVAAPSEAGFDPAALAALTVEIENNNIRNVHAAIVEHAGRLVFERYFYGSDERMGNWIGDRSFNHDSLHDQPPSLFCCCARRLQKSIQCPAGWRDSAPEVAQLCQRQRR